MTGPVEKSLQVLLPTIGSSGDVHPTIALALALRARGHRTTILTYPIFEPLIKSLGIEFLAVGTIAQVEALIGNPDLFHPRKGFALLTRHAIVPAIEPVYRLIEAHANSNTVIAASSLALGARVAQEKLGIPLATVHLQPCIIRSLIDPGMVGNLRLSSTQPLWFKRAFFSLADWAGIDPHLKGPLNKFRATLGLTPISRVLYHWIHSSQCVISLFPDWFAAPQADWPVHTHTVGFPLWDGGGHVPVPAEVLEFLDAGEPPIIFTPGSAGSTMQRFFRESVQAACNLKRRAMLITNFPQQLPRDLPLGVKAFGYVPFSEVLPRAALLVYHGGIGTLAQTIRAGIPHLVVPNGFDQFDNGARIEHLRLGLSIPQSRYRARSATDAIATLLADAALKLRCQEYSSRIDSANTLTRACELIESLAPAATLSSSAPTPSSPMQRPLATAPPKAPRYESQARY